MQLFACSDTFVNNIQQLYGERGSHWLKDLPEIIDELASRYHLFQLKPLNHLSYHYVLSGFQDQQPSKSDSKRLDALRSQSFFVAPSPFIIGSGARGMTAR